MVVTKGRVIPGTRASILLLLVVGVGSGVQGRNRLLLRLLHGLVTRVNLVVEVTLLRMTPEAVEDRFLLAWCLELEGEDLGYHLGQEGPGTFDLPGATDFSG